MQADQEQKDLIKSEAGTDLQHTTLPAGTQEKANRPKQNGQTTPVSREV